MPIGRLNTTQSRVNVPVGTFTDKLMQYGRQQEAKALQEKQMAMNEEHYQTDLGFKQRQEGRLVDKLQLDKDKEFANNEAMKVILHPRQYTQAEKEAVLGNPNVDQNRLFNTETALYKRNVMTPGTAEYEALKLANRAEKDYDANRNWQYAKKREDYNFGHRQTLQNARFTRADDKIKQAKAEQQQLAKVYKDMLNVNPTQQVDKVVNQVAIDSIGNNQLKYGKAYSDYLNKAGFADLDNKRVELVKKVNTTTSPKTKEELNKELNTVMQRLNSLKVAADEIGNNVIGSIGLQDLPNPVIQKETIKKPREQFAKELTRVIPEDMASTDVYKAAESRLNKFYKPVDDTAEGYKRTIKLYGGKVPKTNDVNVLKAVANSVLKQQEKKAGKVIKPNKKETVGSKTVNAITNMFKEIDTPDVIGTGNGDATKTIDRMVKLMEDNNIPDSVMSEFINMAKPKYDSYLWTVNDGPNGDFEKEVKRLVNYYVKTKHK